MDLKEFIDWSPVDQSTFERYYSAFTNCGYVSDGDGDIGHVNIKDVIYTTTATRFVPKVIETVVREALEPNLLISSTVFKNLNIPKGRQIQIGAVGAIHADVIPEGGEYPERNLSMDEGEMVSVTVAKYGLRIAVTDEVIDEGLWDVLGLWLRAAGRALARKKEQTACKLLDELGVTVFDNNGASQNGVLTGRDITGTQNGSMTLNDIFDLYAWLTMRGFTPDTMIMHPLSWSMFMTDPEVREIVIKGATLASRRLPQGGPSPGWPTGFSGLGLRTKATGMGQWTGPDTILGKLGANPWVSDLNPLAATFNIPPQYLPSAVRILVTPYIRYVPQGSSGNLNTCSLAMCDSDNTGAIINTTGVRTEEYDDPARDIRNLKIMERYGMALFEQGRGVGVAKNIIIDRNYVFDNTNTATLSALDTSTYIT